MKLYWLLFISLIAGAPGMFAQGSLTPPPGPPGPTMKRLDQIEPRTAIKQVGTDAHRIITTSGSYYVTENLTDDLAYGTVLEISASNVTVDLNGYTISPAANGTAHAITISATARNVEIRNGHIEGRTTFNGSQYVGSNTFADGISYNAAGGTPRGIRVVGVHVAGIQGDAINVGKSGSVVESCTVDVAGGNGILADVVSNCVVNNGGQSGINANTVQNSHGQATQANASGIYAATVNNSYGYALGTNGFGVNATSAATNSYGQSISGIGLRSSGPATGCVGYSNTGTGLDATSAMNCYGESVTGGAGIRATSSASNSHGKASATGGSGIYVSKGTASNCYGLLSNNNVGGYGIYVAEGTAIGCYGESDGTSGNGYGIQASNAIGCFGRANWIGIEVGTGTAQNCRGIGNNKGIAGNILVSCTGTNLGGSHKYLSGIGPDS